MIDTDCIGSCNSSYQTITTSTTVVSSNPEHGEVLSIQHYVTKVANDFWQVYFFPDTPCLFNWPPRYTSNWNIVESGVKHNNPNPPVLYRHMDIAWQINISVINTQVLCSVQCFVFLMLLILWSVYAYLLLTMCDPSMTNYICSFVFVLSVIKNLQSLCQYFKKQGLLTYRVPGFTLGFFRVIFLVCCFVFFGLCLVSNVVSFSIQSCRSCYATQLLCQRPFYKILVEFRNSKKCT